MRFAKILFLTLALPFFAQANEIEVEIGSNLLGFNTPFVKVTICEPGTQRCQTIDRIKLDTGSSGLRIRREALGKLRFAQVKNRQGSPLMACANMAGGTAYWGPLVRGDVRLGDETAKGATFQIVEDSTGDRKVQCGNVVRDGRNGILGLGPALRMKNGTSLFANGKPEVDFQMWPRNIVNYFERDRNGFVVDLPDVNEGGETNVKGRLIFGIGTQTNNLPEKSVNVCRTRTDQFMLLKFAGQSYMSMLDTGTFSYLLPLAQKNFPACEKGSLYLCPKKNSSFSVELLNENGSTCAVPEVSPRAYQTGLQTITKNHWVLPGLASSHDGGASKAFILGLPFFFGRRVYYVIDGEMSPIGRGPLVAF